MNIPLLPDFTRWSAARFQTEGARDRFLSVVTTRPVSEVEATPMPDESRAALVRWRPGHFLGLNDLAYSQGGRIVIASQPGTGYDRPSSNVRARRGFRVASNT